MNSLSIITICKNNLDDFIKTCKSVDEQVQQPYDHIIVDSSTNDDIINWVMKNNLYTYRLYFREHKNGIAKAFNTGIKWAGGTIIHLLNAGETYVNSRCTMTAMIEFHRNPDLMWFNSKYIQQRGGVSVVSGMRFDKTKLWKGCRTVAPPTFFIKKEVYKRVGLYNTDFKIAMDYDMLVRIRNEKNKFVDKVLVNFAPGGVSSTNFKEGLREVKRSYIEHIFDNMLKFYLWQARQILLHNIMKTQVGKILFRIKNKKNIIP